MFSAKYKSKLKLKSMTNFNFKKKKPDVSFFQHNFIFRSIKNEQNSFHEFSVVVRMFKEIVSHQLTGGNTAERKYL